MLSESLYVASSLQQCLTYPRTWPIYASPCSSFSADILTLSLFIVALDVSADLTELGRTPIAVVCAGIKSILDVGRTLEYLETQGVPVVTVGGEDMVPSFFTASSGYRADHGVDTPAEAAAIIG